MNENTNQIFNKMADIDASFNEAIINNSNNTSDATCEILDKIVENQKYIADRSMDLIDKLDTSYLNTLNKLDTILSSIVTNQQESETNITDIIDSLNIKSNDTQKTLVEYIGKYIVIPLYEQRLNDISTLYYRMLETNIIHKIEKYLVHFRAGDFATLTIEYNEQIQNELAQEILRIKREAFLKFLSTTPGARCFQDMTEEAIYNYKNFRKYISWAYKTLDGLTKAKQQYDDFINCRR